MPLCYPSSMSAPVVTPQGLTAKQEAFAQAVASGLSYSDAYRSAYTVGPDTPGTTTWDDASTLARHPLVRPRIQQLIAAIQAAAVAEVAWDRVRLVTEAAENLRLARTGGWRGAGSANGALELIGRATGLLNDKQQGPPQVQVTQIIINAPGAARVVEGAASSAPAPLPIYIEAAAASDELDAHPGRTHPQLPSADASNT